MFINNPGHMTKMAAMPIYGKNPSKIFFSGTTGSLWWFFLFYVLVFKIFVLLAPYVCFHILVKLK